MNEDMVEIIRQAALLHDVGKIGIPEYILNKAERLTDEEYETIKGHVKHRSISFVTCHRWIMLFLLLSVIMNAMTVKDIREELRGRYSVDCTYPVRGRFL